MDGSRFDALARSLSESGSRRRLIGGLVAGALGLSRVRSAEGRTCTGIGSVCREHATCCSGLCGAKDRTGRRRCTCPGGGAWCAGGCCSDPAQVCGEVIVSYNVLEPACCLPPGAEIPGGCSPETYHQCCAFFYGSGAQYTCDYDTNRCLNPYG
jgi:hypothetical protein